MDKEEVVSKILLKKLWIKIYSGRKIYQKLRHVFPPGTKWLFTHWSC